MNKKMKIHGIGFGATGEKSFEKHLLDMMCELIPSFNVVKEIPENCEVLLINLNRATAKSFTNQSFDDNTYKIVVVHELFRSTLPFLKLADFVIFTNDYQRRICEELLYLSYNSTVLPLPSGDFEYERPQTGKAFVYLDFPYLADSVDIYKDKILSPFAVSKAPHLEGYIYCAPFTNQQDFDSVKNFIETLDGDRTLYNSNELSRSDLQELMKESIYCQYFKNEMGFDDFERHINNRNSGLLHEVIVDSPVLADMKYCGFDMGTVIDITALNFAKAPGVTFKHWAELIQHKIEEEYEISLVRKQGYLDNLEYDTLEDVNVVLGQPLSNKYIFSICFRNQEEKIQRCLESILTQNRDLDFGVVLVDDCSVDASIKKIKEVLDGSGVDCCVVSNKKRNYAARNFYNVVHLYTTNDESIIVEVDGDDFLNGTEVLDTLETYYNNGALKTNGSYKMYPDGQEFMNEADVIRNHERMDYNNPWNLDLCNAWLHLRTSKRHLIKAVEINHFLDRNTHNWLPDRHDAALQPRIIELADGKAIFVKEILYNYDISGDNHDHDNTEWEEEHMKLYGHIDKIYHPIVLGE